MFKNVRMHTVRLTMCSTVGPMARAGGRDITGVRSVTVGYTPLSHREKEQVYTRYAYTSGRVQGVIDAAYLMGT